MTVQKDGLVRMRNLLARRHVATVRKIKTLSSRLIATPTEAEREEMIRKSGEKDGLCYALKVLDKTCQMEMGFK